MTLAPSGRTWSVVSGVTVEPSSRPSGEPSVVLSEPASPAPSLPPSPAPTVTATVTAPAEASCGTSEAPCVVVAPGGDYSTVVAFGLVLVVLLLGVLVAVSARGLR